MVMTQKTIAPMTAAPSASSSNLRNIGYSRGEPTPSQYQKTPKGGASFERPPFASVAEKSALLGPIGLVTAAAILGDAAERALEAVKILDARLRGLGVGTELGEPGVEIRFVGPDRGKRGRVASSL